MVIELNSYMDANASLKERLETYEWSAVEGKYYGVPFITQYNASNAMIIMRQDWLDHLGLSYPETLDDMKAVLEAFTFDDPDGNGQNDTYGFTSDKISSANSTPFDWVFFANGLKYADYALDADDNVIPWFEDPSFIPSMECSMTQPRRKRNSIRVKWGPLSEPCTGMSPVMRAVSVN